MNIEDQVAVLFARANPVPSLDLLDPIDPVDIDALTDESERSSVMTEVQTIEPKKEDRRPLPRLAIGAAIALVAVLIVGLVVNIQGEVASPESVAQAYVDALNAQDIDAVTEVLAPDASDILGLDELPARWEYERATGWVFPSLGCEERSSDADGTLVACRYQIDGSWMRALDLEPAVGVDVLLIKDGRVQSLTEEVSGDSNVQLAWDTFYDWVLRNQGGGEIAKMYLAGNPLYTPEAIPLWEQYTEEFVAEHGG